MPKPFDYDIASRLRTSAYSPFSQRSKKQTDALTYYQNQTEREHELVEHIFNNPA